MSGRGVTFARGFTAGAAPAGVKPGADERLDVALVASDRPCVSAGVLTRNEVIAAPCLLTRRHLERGAVRAIVANSGNANACTGEQGARDALAMATAAAARLDLRVDEVAVASTGVIGVLLPAERIARAVAGIELTEEGWDAASHAIMTTDTRPKVADREITLPSGAVRVGGIAKGAGMIHPDMATLLAFITTDARIAADDLAQMVVSAVDSTFNAISVDGDTSTNDTVLVLANGASGIDVAGTDLVTFASGLSAVCRELALAIVADGEGVTKVYEIRVSGAASDADARLAARQITDSNLVRTAIHGADPNWGRILAAAGRSGARVESERASIAIGGVAVFTAGAPAAFDGAAIRAHFSRASIEIALDLGLGNGTAVAWGADLSAEYVRINAEYTT